MKVFISYKTLTVASRLTLLCDRIHMRLHHSKIPIPYCNHVSDCSMQYAVGTTNHNTTVIFVVCVYLHTCYPVRVYCVYPLGCCKANKLCL